MDKQRYLDKLYPLFTKEGFKEFNDKEVDEKIIKKAGKRGWSFLLLPLISIYIGPTNFNSETLEFEHIGMLIYQGVLFFGGLFLAYSWVALKFLKDLNIKSYKKETFEEQREKI